MRASKERAKTVPPLGQNSTSRSPQPSAQLADAKAPARPDLVADEIEAMAAAIEKDAPGIWRRRRNRR